MIPVLFLAALVAQQPYPYVNTPAVAVYESFEPRSLSREIRYCSGDQPAIDLAWPDAPSVAMPTLDLEAVTVIDAGMVTDAFGNHPFAPCRTAVRLTNAWNAQIRGLTCWGAQTCLELRGRSNDVHIVGLHSYGAKTHIAILEQSEGTTVDDARIIGGSVGVFVQTDPGRPGLWVTNSHINTTSRGIVVRNHPQVNISGNLLYRQGTGPYVGIELGAGTTDYLVRGNTVMCGAGGSMTAGFYAVPGLARPIINDLDNILCAVKQAVSLPAAMR